MSNWTENQIEAVAKARWELEIARYPEHAQHMINTWAKLGEEGRNEIREEAKYMLEALRKATR